MTRLGIHILQAGEYHHRHWHRWEALGYGWQYYHPRSLLGARVRCVCTPYVPAQLSNISTRSREGSAAGKRGFRVTSNAASLL